MYWQCKVAYKEGSFFPSQFTSQVSRPANAIQAQDRAFTFGGSELLSLTPEVG